MRFSRIALRRSLGLAVAASLATALSGCASGDDFSDAIQSINPFAQKEETLPGARKAVLDGQDPLQGAGGRTVSVGSARAIGTWQQAGGTASNNAGHVAMSGSGNRIFSTRAGSPAGGGGFTGGTEVRVFARPVIGNGAAYVFDPTGTVSAISLGGGRSWSTSLKPQGSDDLSLGGGVATDGARVYAASGYRAVVSLDAGSGRVAWSHDLPEPARGAPAIGDGKIFVVAQGNAVYALNQGDGSEAWSYRGIPEASGLLTRASPAVSGNVVVVPFSSGELVALDTKTGNPLWNEALTRAGPTLAVSGLSDIAASPVIDEGVVIATGVGGKTVAFALKSGERIWESPIGSAHTPIVSGGAVFLVDLDDRLVALDRKSGAVAWVSQLPAAREDKRRRTNWAGPMLAGGQLWAVSNGGAMVSADPTSGRLTAARANAVPPAYISPIAAQGVMLVLSGDGTLSGFN